MDDAVPPDAHFPRAFPEPHGCGCGTGSTPLSATMLLSLHLCQAGAIGGFNRSFTQTLARHVFVVVECRHDLSTTINPAVRQNNIRPHFVAYLLQGLSHGLRRRFTFMLLHPPTGKRSGFRDARRLLTYRGDYHLFVIGISWYESTCKRSTP